MQENSQTWNSVAKLILKISLFLAVAAHLTSSIHMPQFFEHLAIGHWIMLNHAVPKSYIWSTGISNWQDSNWLFEVLISLLETNFGELGLILFKISSIFLAICSFYLLFLRFSENAFFAACLALFVSSGVFVSSDLLPYCLSVFLLSFFILIVTKEQYTKTNIITLFLLGYLLANIDASLFIFALGSLVLVESKKQRYALSIVLIVSLFAPPYYGRQVLQALNNVFNALSWDILLQRNAANIFDFKFAFLLLLWMLIGFKSKCIFNQKQKTLLFFSVFSSILGLASTDYLSLGVALAALLLSTLWRQSDSLEQGLGYLEQSLSRLSPLGVIWVIVVICVITIKPRIEYPISYALLPKKQVDLMFSRGIKLPVYHDSFAGSYLAYRFATSGIPTEKAVLSTMQSESYSKAARMNYLSQSLNPKFLQYFDFIAPKSVICRQSEPLYSYLSKDENWLEIEPGSKELFGWSLFERSK